MPKITNWSPRGEDTWDHDIQNLVVDVWSYEAAPKKTLWEFTITNPDTNENFAPYDHGSFSNKGDARDAAISWMKSHPKPDYEYLRRKYKG